MPLGGAHALRSSHHLQLAEALIFDLTDPLARSIGGGIGIAVAGALVVRAVGRDAMNNAEQATSAVPTIAAAVQHSNLLLAGVCLVSLPAVLLLRRG